MASQTTIGRHFCKRLATNQFTQLKLAHKNKESVDSVKSISKFIDEKTMTNMTQKVMYIDQSGKYKYESYIYIFIIFIIKFCELPI